MISTYILRHSGVKYKFKSIANYAKDKVNVHKKIVKTPFEVYDTYDDEPSIDYKTYSADICVINLTKLFKNAIKLSPKALALIMFIYYTMEPDSNVVRIHSRAFADYFSRSETPRQFFKYVQELVDNNFICKATGTALYVVNHNLIHKGDLNHFASLYRTFYGKWVKAEFNESNRIPVHHRVLANQYKDAGNDLEGQINKLDKLGLYKFSFIKQNDECED